MLSVTTPDSVKASIYMDDSAKVIVSNNVGTYQGYLGVDNSVNEMGVWAKAGTSAPVWIGSLNDGTGIRITDQSGIVMKQYTATERSQRVTKGYANSDPVHDIWQFKSTTTNATPTVVANVRFDSSATTNEDYSGYSNRPGSYIVYVDVVGARTDADGYLM